MGKFFFTERKKSYEKSSSSWIYNLVILTPLFLNVNFSVRAEIRTNITDVTHDPRGEFELTVCSQNLQNYGRLKDAARRIKGLDEAGLLEKRSDLVRRFHEAGCDVIALQELIGGNEQYAKESLEELVAMLQYRTNRWFDIYLSPSNDKALRLGYLVARDTATLRGMTSYRAVELPKISETQKPRLFSRGPFEIRLQVNGKDGASSRLVKLVTFHFKSRAFNSQDGAELEWETYRMEMAEALRTIVLNRHQSSLEGDGSLVILLGDRNSHFDTASAKILSGELTLRSFQGTAPCRLSKRGVPLCKPGNANPPTFTSVLTTDPEVKQTAGSYLYEKTFSWLDDILIPTSQLPFAFSKDGIEGNYESGVISKHEKASDHSLVYVRLNW